MYQFFPDIGWADVVNFGTTEEAQAYVDAYRSAGVVVQEPGAPLTTGMTVSLQQAANMESQSIDQELADAYNAGKTVDWSTGQIISSPDKFSVALPGGSTFNEVGGAYAPSRGTNVGISGTPVQTGLGTNLPTTTPPTTLLAGADFSGIFNNLKNLVSNIPPAPQMSPIGPIGNLFDSMAQGFGASLLSNPIILMLLFSNNGGRNNNNNLLPLLLLMGGKK